MSTTVTYKGSTLTTVNNNTKTLKTAGKYMEGDVILVDVTEGGGSGSGVVWQDAQGYIHLSDEGDITLQTKTVTPTESAQTITADAGYYALDEVNVGAISSTYVGSGITRRSSSDLTASGATVTVPSGYYSAQVSKAVASGTAGTPTATKVVDTSDASATVTPSVTNTSGYITGGTKTGTAVTISASELVSGNTIIVDDDGVWNVTKAETLTIPSGTAGTPTATKGTVSNHSISVTPAVTNTSGWINGSTKTGTAVTVTASELVSGSETKTENGTYDVTNLAELVVNVSGGGSGGLEYETGTLTLSSDQSTPIISFTNTHTDVPIYINITDVTETLATDNSNLYWTFMNWYTLNDSFIKTTSSANLYGRYQYGWKTSSGASAGNVDCTNTGTSSGGLYYLVATDRFGPYCGGTSRYWRAGRTYKWIAVWAPTA